jgi:hypothetical protein
VRLNKILLKNLKNYTVLQVEEVSKEGRCEGKSTALALNYIAQAISNEGKWVSVVDHYGTKVSSRHLFNEVRRIVGLLELVGFEYRADNMLRCCVYIEI